MNYRTVNDEYFHWLVGIIQKDDNAEYDKLLSHLHEVNFQSPIELDENRAYDGCQLRYLFGENENYNPSIISYYIDIRPCSLLEMIIALVIRFEHDICYDQSIGDRTKYWFWEIIKNMNLIDMDDDHYDRNKVSAAIDILLSRSYERNGKNGMFTIYHTDRDMRTADFWYQAMWYLNEQL